MKTITYDEWYKKFKLKNNVDEPDADQCEFFDNGAVRDAEGDFVVKVDQVIKL